MRTIDLVVRCEGQTEARFVDEVVAPHLRAHRVFARSRPLTESAFGTVPWGKLYTALREDAGNLKPHQYLTTLVDPYGLREFPDLAARTGESGAERARRIEASMAGKLRSPQFLPHLQVHEFETFVFVRLEELTRVFPDGDGARAAAALAASVKGLGPEEVNDGPKTAPSKRLIAALPAYEGAKAFAGPAIAGLIGLTELRKACPHFGAWLTRLEGLAGAPPSDSVSPTAGGSDGS